ncbi:MAG: TIGR00282 family metallophosphoesterase [Ruminococcaceae bacterium]|nr:TIGR00282 family metallophosphoesterase [Oscillospiraceae bacterium]
MKILAIGDIVGDCGTDFAVMVLPEIRRTYQIDLCIANAENAAEGSGITQNIYYRLSDAGVDGFTMGNHTFQKKDAVALLEKNSDIIRPANYPDGVPGKGYMLLHACGKTIGVINLMGRFNLLNLDCPFRTADALLEELKDKCDFVVADFHAEASSEKIAFGYYLDGRATAVFGTHTHVQTADECILPKGTGYISDLGMTGAIESVLGIKKEIIIRRFLTQMPQKFENAYGKARLCGAVFTIDENNRCTAVERIAVV